MRVAKESPYFTAGFGLMVRDVMGRPWLGLAVSITYLRVLLGVHCPLSVFRCSFFVFRCPFFVVRCGLSEE
jgi:hypothetical protein